MLDKYAFVLENSSSSDELTEDFEKKANVLSKSVTADTKKWQPN
jgi:hypothetical protein